MPKTSNKSTNNIIAKLKAVMLAVATAFLSVFTTAPASAIGQFASRLCINKLPLPQEKLTPATSKSLTLETIPSTFATLFVLNRFLSKV